MIILYIVLGVILYALLVLMVARFCGMNSRPGDE